MENKQLDTKDLLMNKKEELIWRVIDNVISCCAVTRIDGAKSITREDVVGKSREENVVLTRCLVVEQMVHAGFTISTIAFILNRTVQAIRHLLKISNDYYESSRAFRLATSEKSAMQDKINALQTQLTTEHQSGVIAQQIAAAVNPIAQAVNEIKCAQPQTVTVPYQPFQAVPNCVAYQYGMYNNGNLNGFWL